MLNKSFFTCNSDEYSTPQDLFDFYDSSFHFTLDPCASSSNHKCSKYYTISDNGLLQSWSNEIVFCNPPYSNIKEWVKKCYYEYINNNATIVLLIPARTDTLYFHKYVYHIAYLQFIQGRLHFNDLKDPAPFPSVVCIYDRSIYYV